jgi:aspartate-semialdehyde dehydrogenase
MPPKPIKLIVFGATGLVGRTMLQVLAERQLPLAELIPLASPRSKGVEIPFGGKTWIVSTPAEEKWKHAEYALLSPGAKVSAEWAPRLAAAGVVCIDNSSAFRMDEDVPLVVPEVNPEALYNKPDSKESGHTIEEKPDHKWSGHPGIIIANPNCSTIQMVVALQPLHRAFGLEEVVVATYQSASGAGQKGASQLLSEMEGEITESYYPALDKGGQGGINYSSPFPHPLFNNLVPSIGKFSDGYCNEEWKMVYETRKIMSLPDLKVYPTTVRVPTLSCHAEVLHLHFRDIVSVTKAREVLAATPGIIVQDNPDVYHYPQPLNVAGKDEVFIGRLRQMPGADHTLDLWVVADNLRKGAATNAVQILELLLRKDNVG